MEQYTKTSSPFYSQNTRCIGELYLPGAVKTPPVVVMAHGFAAERTFGLPDYAEKFAENGLAVFLFDYRCFGGSDGTPRNLVDPKRHLADWAAAIDHVRSLQAIDARRMALWGSSFSGGHVIVTAARKPGIAAIVAQVPFVDAVSTSLKLGPKHLMRALPHGIRDLSRMLTFRAPHYVKVVGKPDEFAVMNTPESYDGYTAIIPEDADWENGCPARILLKFAAYRPTAHAKNVKCPALLMAGEYDSLINIEAVEKTANKMPNGRLIKYPLGHFDLYKGDAFADAVQKQTDFLLTHLAS
jgi:pimeloyl-ACP methyl ester carboxylesterase